MGFQTRPLPERHDVIAPDGSLIRLLGIVAGGSMVHCTLPAGGVSLAVTHQTVAELWFVVARQGLIWRRLGEQEEVVEIGAGTALAIPLGTWFQFRADGDTDLEIVIVTMPPWAGDSEAVRVPDHWPTTAGPDPDPGK